MEKQTTKNIYAVIAAVSALVLVFLIVGIFSIELGRNFYTDRTSPRQYFEDYNISGITSIEAAAYLQSILDEVYNSPTTFEFDNNEYQVTLKQLGDEISFEENLAQVQIYNGKPGFKQFFVDVLLAKKSKAKIDIDVLEFEKNLLANIPTLKNPKPANFEWADLVLVINPEQTGNKTDYAKLRDDLINRDSPIPIPVETVIPKVNAADLEPVSEEFEAILKDKLKFTFENQTFDLPISEFPEKIYYEKTDDKLVAKIDDLFLFDFVESTLKDKIEKLSESLEITYKDKKVEFIGSGKSGLEIDHEKLIATITEALNTKKYQIVIPTTVIEPTLTIDPALQAKGIKEIVATGYTTYYGSPANRMHNIKVGAEIYNGMIIEKGEKFSFNETLGPVDASTGYLPELVIKSEGTIPEYGGGLCQVSTTIYRTALLGGFKIDERYNHSYAVSYYAQVLGDGLDATIYPGVKDFKFTNDTDGAILMQAIIDGPTLTYRFFGTADDRKVELDGPKILLKTGSGSPRYIVDPNLPPGTVKLKQSAHGGLHTDWIRKITYPNGKVTEEVIPSRYRAVPPEYLVSPDHPSVKPAPITPVVPLPPAI